VKGLALGHHLPENRLELAQCLAGVVGGVGEVVDVGEGVVDEGVG